uniref:NADH dehydrogenase subunit 4L n=1 Tax=Anchistus australis TaxID=1296376 RepID=UPI0013E959DF|nr:NADH dehydrogenase subunit 4L [Anchistus australis]QHR79569.1 NADH dehydrogenase subunit 4L [Anchistus australis]
MQEKVIFSYIWTSVILFCLLIGFFSLVKNRKYFLSALMSLEFLVVVSFMLQSYIFVISGLDLYFTLFFLALSACEGALGLSILVALVRSTGSDSFHSHSTLVC